MSEIKTVDVLADERLCHCCGEPFVRCRETYRGTSAAVDVLAANEEITAVVALMESFPLCPSFLSIMEPGDLPYEGAARIGVRNPAWDREDGRDVPEWIDGDPIYPGSPDARRFFGNFTGLSRMFTIDTDDEWQIAQMRAAISANLAKFGGAK